MSTDLLFEPHGIVEVRIRRIIPNAVQKDVRWPAWTLDLRALSDCRAVVRNERRKGERGRGCERPPNKKTRLAVPAGVFDVVLN